MKSLSLSKRSPHFFSVGISPDFQTDPSRFGSKGHSASLFQPSKAFLTVLLFQLFINGTPLEGDDQVLMDNCVLFSGASKQEALYTNPHPELSRI
jgi:hypothetical protein